MELRHLRYFVAEHIDRNSSTINLRLTHHDVPSTLVRSGTGIFAQLPVAVPL